MGGVHAPACRPTNWADGTRMLCQIAFAPDAINSNITKRAISPIRERRRQRELTPANEIKSALFFWADSKKSAPLEYPQRVAKASEAAGFPEGIAPPLFDLRDCNTVSTRHFRGFG